MEILLLNVRDSDTPSYFRFSKEFIDEFKCRTGIQLKYDEEHTDIRTDPTAIAIFKEKGAEWSSYPWRSFAPHEGFSIRLQTVPLCMIDHYTFEEDETYDLITYHFEAAYTCLLFEFIHGAIDKATLLRKTALIAELEDCDSLSPLLQSYLPSASASVSSYTAPVQENQPTYFS
jgi:hypothetical protein